jgi:hypothetical protein
MASGDRGRGRVAGTDTLSTKQTACHSTVMNGKSSRQDPLLDVKVNQGQSVRFTHVFQPGRGTPTARAGQ